MRSPTRGVPSLLLASVCLASLLASRSALGQAGCCMCTECAAPELFACRQALDAAACETTCSGLGCGARTFLAGADCLDVEQCFGDCCNSADTGCSQVPKAACTPVSCILPVGTPTPTLDATPATPACTPVIPFFENSYCDGSSCLAAPISTATPSVTPTPPEPTATSTPTASSTATATAMPSSTPTATATASATRTRTATPSPTRTATPTTSATPTGTATPSPTRTATATAATRTGTATPSPTRTATATTSATPTQTPPPTGTATATPSATATATATLSSTSTATATLTGTVTATPTTEPSDFSFLIDGTTSMTRLVGIPVGGFSYRIMPLRPSLQLLDAHGRFCFAPGMLTRLHLDLPAQDCANDCLLGVFSSGTADRMNIARLPEIRRGAGTYDLLIDVFEPCGENGMPITLRLRNAVTYVDCAGDCDANGQITIDELMLGVTIGLDPQSAGRCPAFDLNGDGEVQINELVSAVRHALEGCGA
jgi:hypothetical protein